MKRKQLRKSDIRNLNQELNKLFNKDMLNKSDKIFFVKDQYKTIEVNEQQLYFYDFDAENKIETLLPTLKLCQTNCPLKKITVDMGAVRFVTKGADIMRPGITEIEDEIEKNEYVAVIDENNKKPLSICKTMFSGEEIKSMDSGKVLKNIHFVGDELWNL